MTAFFEKIEISLILKKRVLIYKLHCFEEYI